MVSKASALRGMLSGVRASGWRRHGRVGYGGQVSLLKLVIGKGIRRRRSRLVQIGNGKGGGIVNLFRFWLFFLFGLFCLFYFFLSFLSPMSFSQLMSFVPLPRWLQSSGERCG